MINLLNRVDIRAKIPGFLRRPLRSLLYFFVYHSWMIEKHVPPPHVVKVNKIRAISKKNVLTTLVETGTYYGDTIDSVRSDFSKIYSIELDRKLFKRAKKVFKNDKNIKIINGDSGSILKNLLGKIKEPTLFWLDAHYSGEGTAKGKQDTPIVKEVKIINKYARHKIAILIDDAREFNGSNDYPKIQDFLKFIKELFPNHVVAVENDMICIQPKEK